MFNPSRYKKNKPVVLTIGLFVGLYLVVLFQNCSIIPTDDSGIKSLDSSGNGEPYTGFQAKPGFYYSFVPEFSCEPDQTKLVDSNVKSFLEVKSVSDVAILTDNCTGNTEELSLATVAATVEPDYVVAGEELLQRIEVPPTTKRPFPVVFCNILNPIIFNHIEHTVFYNPQTKNFKAFSRTRHRDSNNLAITTRTSRGMVKASLETFPANIPSIKFSDQNFFTLLVSNQVWNPELPFLTKGLYLDVINGLQFRRLAVCLNLKNAKKFNILR